MTSSRDLRRRCFFCGGQPLVKSHVLDRRWRQIGHRGSLASPGRVWEDVRVGDKITRRSTVETGGAAQPPGALVDDRARVACPACLGGWMTTLEDTATPHLALLAQGTPHDITPDAAVLVTAWLAKTAILFEQTMSPDIRPSVSPTQRTALVEGRLPEYFETWGYPLKDAASSPDMHAFSRRAAHADTMRPVSPRFEFGMVSIHLYSTLFVCVHAVDPMVMSFLGQPVQTVLGMRSHMRTSRPEAWPSSRGRPLTRDQANSLPNDFLRACESLLR